MKLCYLWLILCTTFISCFGVKENQSCSLVQSLFQSRSSAQFFSQTSVKGNDRLVNKAIVMCIFIV